jgi:uncharacterized protein DUF3300
MVLAVAMLVPCSPLAGRGAAAEPPTQSAAAAPGPAPGEATPEELEEVVSPIALYPDLLVARILVASYVSDSDRGSLEMAATESQPQG